MSQENHHHGHDCGCGGEHQHQENTCGCEVDFHDHEDSCGCGGDHHHEDSCGCGEDHHHHHEDSCGCGGHHHHHGQIFLTMENGQEVACDVLDIFEINGQGYIALLPEGEEDVFIYRFKEEEYGPQLALIEEQEEFDLVSQTFLANFAHDHEEEDGE